MCQCAGAQPSLYRRHLLQAKQYKDAPCFHGHAVSALGKCCFLATSAWSQAGDACDLAL